LERTYECMCLLDNREVRKGWESLKGSVAAVFTKHNAKVLSSRRWDERRLTYPINGQIRATYLLLYMSIETDEIPVLRRDLQFSESVLRYMITDCAELPADAHEPETEFDVNAIPEDDAPEPEPTKPGAKSGAKDGAAKDGAAKDGAAKGGDAKDGDAKAAEAKDSDAKDGDAAESPAAADGEEKK
jgi:small subunit ribosomal protein S6